MQVCIHMDGKADDPEMAVTWKKDIRILWQQYYQYLYLRCHYMQD